jgi:hypothetical protein
MRPIGFFKVLGILQEMGPCFLHCLSVRALVPLIRIDNAWGSRSADVAVVTEESLLLSALLVLLQRNIQALKATALLARRT